MSQPLVRLAHQLAANELPQPAGVQDSDVGLCDKILCGEAAEVQPSL